MITSSRSRNSVPRKTTIYNKFRGVDFSVDSSLVDKDRSPFAPNLIADIGGMPEKRLGWRTLHTIEQPVNGLFFGEINGVDTFIAHGGTKLYKWTMLTFTEIKSGVNNAKSTAFFMKENNKGKIYILTGNDYLVYDGTTITSVSDSAYVPTILISRNPTGGGTVLEAVNLIGNKRKESFLGDASSTVYQLSANNITSVDLVQITNASGGLDTLVAGTDYTVNLVTGKITFTAAHAPIVVGQDNVFITYSKTVTGYADRIKKCTISTLYGLGGSNRVFVSGNPDYKSYDWYSQIFNPSYFPDLGYSVVGSDDTAIMGYQKLGKFLIIIKEDNQQDSTIFQRWGTLQSDGSITFAIEQGIAGTGAISKYCFANLIDEPLLLSRRGIMATTNTNILAERTIKNRSYYIDSQLINEPNMQNAVATEWNGYYVLAVNNKAYILDSRNKAFKNESGSDFVYECYQWENIPAVCFLSIAGELYFGTATGKICKFNTDITDRTKYNDDNTAVTCYWSTKNDDDGASYLYKTMQKKGCAATIKPFSRSSAKICVVVDGNPEVQIRSHTMDVFDWEDIDLERFTFNLNFSPQDVYFKKKVKKYKRLQIIIKNEGLSEGFGIFQIVKTFTVGNYAKK